MKQEVLKTHALLGSLVATKEVVRGDALIGGAEDLEGGVMVLVVLPDLRGRGENEMLRVSRRRRRRRRKRDQRRRNEGREEARASADTHTREIRDNRNAELLEKTSLADSRALEDLRSAESSARENDELETVGEDEASQRCRQGHRLKATLRLDDVLLGSIVTAVDGVDVGNADGLLTFEDDTGASGVAEEVEVLLELAKRVNVACGDCSRGQRRS
jgi:hypothetical protein